MIELDFKQEKIRQNRSNSGYYLWIILLQTKPHATDIERRCLDYHLVTFVYDPRSWGKGILGNKVLYMGRGRQHIGVQPLRLPNTIFS